MARIRSIHPGIWTDEAFVSVSPAARLLFLGILNECDDQGAFDWKPLQIKMRLAPADNVQVNDLLAELAGGNMIQRYFVGAASYGAVRNFRQWQRPKKPNFVHPMPDHIRTYTGPKPGLTADSSEIGGDDGVPVPPSGEAVPHQLPTSGEKSPQMEDGVGKEGGRKEERTPKPPRVLVASDDDPGFAEFWAAYPRKDDKGHARKAWTKAIGKADVVAIVAGTRGYQFNENPRFIPLPATWLNGERWLQATDCADDMDPVLKAAGCTQADLDQWRNQQPIPSKRKGSCNDRRNAQARVGFVHRQNDRAA